MEASEPGSRLEAALAEAHARYAEARPNSAALHASALKVMPGGNTRTVLGYRPFPVAMSRGMDRRLWDVDGHEYLDFCGEYSAGLFGHSNPTIRRALTTALRNGISLAAVGEGEVRLASLLCERFPSIESIRFTNSGTEANMMAVSLARAYTGRPKLLAFKGGYHGGCLMFTSGSVAEVNAPFPIALADYNDEDGAAKAIEATGADLAAVIVEPMLGGGGGIPATAAFLETLRAAARRTGALLIFDEVMTSRMSAGGLQQRLGVAPDLTTLGKYIGGGMSFGAFGGRAEVMDLFSSRLPHAGTFNNNVMTMAAGYAGLNSAFTPAAAEALYIRGEKIRDRLNAILRLGVADMQFTGSGSLFTAHFRSGTIHQPYAPSARENVLRELFFFHMLEGGVYCAFRGQFALSLEIRRADVVRLADGVASFIVHYGDWLCGADALAMSE